MKYKTEKDGMWIQPRQEGYKMMCCDCGLVHKIDFRIIGKKVQFKAERDNRATGQARRWIKFIK